MEGEAQILMLTSRGIAPAYSQHFLALTFRLAHAADDLVTESHASFRFCRVLIA